LTGSKSLHVRTLCIVKTNDFNYTTTCILLSFVAKGFCYDVFISAHDECRELVENMILLPLERDCNPPYIICWHMRNFIAGIPIMEQITDAVYQSRKVVFVFSEHFMESTFCRMELEQAMHRLLTSRTRCLVPIALSEDAVPQELKSKLTYWPLVNVQEENLLERITKLLGMYQKVYTRK